MHLQLEEAALRGEINQAKTESSVQGAESHDQNRQGNNHEAGVTRLFQSGYRIWGLRGDFLYLLAWDAEGEGCENNKHAEGGGFVWGGLQLCETFVSIVEGSFSPFAFGVSKMFP